MAIYHARPSRFPVSRAVAPTGVVGLQQLRTVLYELYVAENERNKLKGTISSSIGRVGLAGQAISELQFGVMYRGMMTHSRLWDVDAMKYQEDLNESYETAIKAGAPPIFKEIITEASLAGETKGAIESLQRRKISDFNCWPELNVLEPDNEQDRRRYLLDVLPKLMGENLARFHNTGAYHRYAHPGNWTLAGELVDLDSVRHPDISQDEIPFTVEEVFYEVLDSALSLQHITQAISPHFMQEVEIFSKFFHSYVDVSNGSFTQGTLEMLCLSQYVYDPVHGALRDDFIDELLTQPPVVLSIDDSELVQLAKDYARQEPITSDFKGSAWVREFKAGALDGFVCVAVQKLHEEFAKQGLEAGTLYGYEHAFAFELARFLSVVLGGEEKQSIK